MSIIVFYFQKKQEKYYQQHKKEINYYRKCEPGTETTYLDKKMEVPTADAETGERKELRAVIEELKADNQPYRGGTCICKKVQSCADIARP